MNCEKEIKKIIKWIILKCIMLKNIRPKKRIYYLPFASQETRLTLNCYQLTWIWQDSLDEKSDGKEFEGYFHHFNKLKLVGRYLAPWEKWTSLIISVLSFLIFLKAPPSHVATSLNMGSSRTKISIWLLPFENKRHESNIVHVYNVRTSTHIKDVSIVPPKKG